MTSDSNQPVPFLDLAAGYQRHSREFDEAFQRIAGASAFVLSKPLESFEQEFSSYCGAEHAVGCASGTDALELALEALGLGPGDEVITVSHTFAATISSILRVGATPVLVDVKADSLLMDPDLLDASIGPATAAIVVVHLYGSICPMQSVMEAARRHNLVVVEDAAQAHGSVWRGARAGAVGNAGCFSFYPGKNLGAFGDGGMVVTDDRAVASTLRQLRDHGKPDKHSHTRVGRNSRLDGLQAELLSIKLKHLEEENEDRRRAFAYYKDAFAGRDLPVELVPVPDGVTGVHHLCVIQTDYRDSVRARLQEAGVQSGIHYPVPNHLQPAFKDKVRLGSSMRVTESACERILSLPIFPYITQDQQDRVIEALAQALDRSPLSRSKS